MFSPPCPQDMEQLGLFGSQNPIKAGREVGLRAAAPAPASTSHLPSLEKPNPISPGGSSSLELSSPSSSSLLRAANLEGGKVLQHHSSISLLPHPTLPVSWSCSELPVWNWKQILPLVCSQHWHHPLLECWGTSAGCSSKHHPGAQPDPAGEEGKRWNGSCMDTASPGWNSTGHLLGLSTSTAGGRPQHLEEPLEFQQHPSSGAWLCEAP